MSRSLRTRSAIPDSSSGSRNWEQKTQMGNLFAQSASDSLPLSFNSASDSPKFLSCAMMTLCGAEIV